MLIIISCVTLITFLLANALSFSPARVFRSRCRDTHIYRRVGRVLLPEADGWASARKNKSFFMHIARSRAQTRNSHHQLNSSDYHSNQNELSPHSLRARDGRATAAGSRSGRAHAHSHGDRASPIDDSLPAAAQRRAGPAACWPPSLIHPANRDFFSHRALFVCFLAAALAFSQAACHFIRLRPRRAVKVNIFVVSDLINKCGAFFSSLGCCCCRWLRSPDFRESERCARTPAVRTHPSSTTIQSDRGGGVSGEGGRKKTV